MAVRLGLSFSLSFKGRVLKVSVIKVMFTLLFYVCMVANIGMLHT